MESGAARRETRAADRQRRRINYLPKNVAPEVDDVTVMVGSVCQSSAHTSNTNSDSSGFDSPIPTVPDRHSIAVKWRARDANDDSACVQRVLPRRRRDPVEEVA